MIQSFMLVTASGVVLFHQAFTHSLSQPRLVGGLLRALAEFSRASLGMPVAHVHMDSLSLTLVEAPLAQKLIGNAAGAEKGGGDRESQGQGGGVMMGKGKNGRMDGAGNSASAAIANGTSTTYTDGGVLTSVQQPKAPISSKTGDRLMCAIFHDSDSSDDLAALLASELLSAFLQQFALSLESLQIAAMARMEAEFSRFSARTFNVLREAYKPILQDLDRNPEIQVVVLLRTTMSYKLDATSTMRILLYSSDNNKYGNAYASQILAMMNAAHDLLTLRQQLPYALRIGRNLLVQRLDKDEDYLLLTMSDSLSSTNVIRSTNRARSLLDELFDLLKKFQGS